MKWTKEVNEMLTLLYNENKTDLEIAEYMNSTVYAIGKQRCVLGLTKFTMKKGITKAPKQIKKEMEIPDCIAFYIKDGKDHILHGSLDTIKTKAIHIMRENNLKSLTVYKPATQLVVEQIKEVQLKS
jgi:hypothetical protein